MTIPYIRERYDKPWLHEGVLVKTPKGEMGVVTGASGSYIEIRMEGCSVSLPYHPDDLEPFDEPE